MNILVLADEESKYLWDYFEKSKLDNIDLIISCGDLKPQYLSFLATFAKVPIRQHLRKDVSVLMMIFMFITE